MSKPELSICIPTYNRASILDETLAHLAQVDNLLLEVIVSDNASSDNTEEIVKKYNDKFPRFIYHRQSSNIGALNNTQSAFSFASSPLSYLLCDDDRIVPQTFRKIIDIMMADPTVVGVYGNHCEYDPYTGEEFEVYQNIQAEEQFVAEDRATLFEQVGQLWLPVTRTEVNQRFCYSDDTTFGYWRMVGMLFKHGAIVVIPDLVYKHAKTIPRMEFKLIEPWYHDMHRSDYELFIAGLNVDHSIEGITDHIGKFVNERSIGVYLGGFDFAAQQEKYLLQRHYLLRAKCYNLVSDDKVQVWEENFILHCLLERIEALLKGLPDVKQIMVEASSVTEYLLRIKSQERFSDMPEMKLCSVESLSQREAIEGEMILVMDYSTLKEKKIKKQGYEFSLLDMVNTLRVTDGDLDIKAN